MKNLIRSLTRCHMNVVTIERVPDLQRGQRLSETVVLPVGLKWRAIYQVQGLLNDWELAERLMHRVLRSELHRRLYAER